MAFEVGGPDGVGCVERSCGSARVRAPTTPARLLHEPLASEILVEDAGGGDVPVRVQGEQLEVATTRRAAYYAREGLTDPAAGVFEGSHIYAPVSRQCVEDGDKVHRGPTPDEVKDGYNVPVTFEVAIKESGVIDCEPIIPLAKELIDFVEGVVARFDPFFV